jgi:tyrosinase
MQFSNTAYIDKNNKQYDSLEAIHNDIHGYVGNGGHMGEVAYSAFDPIFWLHHT